MPNGSLFPCWQRRVICDRPLLEYPEWQGDDRPADLKTARLGGDGDPLGQRGDLSDVLAEFTQRELSHAIRVPYQRINEIVNQRRGITCSTALRLAKYFGTSADYWLNVQMRWDL